jgi:hypothetical protein
MLSDNAVLGLLESRDSCPDDQDTHENTFGFSFGTIYSASSIIKLLNGSVGKRKSSSRQRSTQKICGPVRSSGKQQSYRAFNHPTAGQFW